MVTVGFMARVGYGFVLWVGIASLTSFTGFTGGSVFAKPRLLDSIIAVVNDEIITLSDYKKKYKQLTVENPELREIASFEIKQKIVDALVLEKVVTQIAYQAGIRIDDIQFNQALRSIAKENKLSLLNFKKTIESTGVSWTEYQQGLRNKIIIQQAYRFLVAEQIEISEQDIKNYLVRFDKFENKNKEYKVSQIYLSFDGKTDVSTVTRLTKKMKGIRSEIKGGTSFSAAASQYSQSSDSLNGGQMGWRRANELPVTFLNTIVKMKPGDISQPIRGDYGYHMIFLQKIRDATSSEVLETQYKVRSIIIRKDFEKSVDLLEKLIAGIKNRIDAGEDFSTLATQYSQDSNSASLGGDLGWVSLEIFPSEITESLANAKKGALIGPLTSRFGYHLFLVENTRKVPQNELNRANFAREQIIKERINDAIDRWQQSLIASALIEYKSFNP